MRTINFKKKIHGPVFSIVTPFKKNGNIDFISLFKVLKFYYLNNVRIFYLMTYNSRLGLLSDEEVLKLNIRISNFLKKNYKDTIFIGATKFEGSANETLKRIKQLSKFRVDICSIIFGEKFYNEKQVYAHFKYINDNTTMPLLLHLQMMMNGHGVKPPVVDYSINLTNKICSLKNFVAIKEDAKNHQFTVKLIKKIKNKVIIIRAGGGMSAWKNYKLLGCQSWLVGMELIDPKIAFDFVKALKNKNKNFLNNLENKIEKPFFKEVSKYGWHIFIKSCFEICNLMKRDERLPLKKLDKTDHQKVEKYLVKLRYLCKKHLGYEYFKKI